MIRIVSAAIQFNTNTQAESIRKLGDEVEAFRQELTHNTIPPRITWLQSFDFIQSMTILTAVIEGEKNETISDAPQASSP